MSMSSKIDKFMTEISESDELQMISFRLKESLINEIDEYSQTLSSIAKGDEIVSRSALIEMFIEGGVEELGRKLEEYNNGLTDTDIEDESTGKQRFFLLNTNIKHNKNAHNKMIENGEASAFYDHWKMKIKRLQSGDIVFLYQSGRGIVGYGLASGKLEMREYEGHKDEDYTQKLNDFVRLDKPVSARKMKDIAKKNFFFAQTMVQLKDGRGEALLDYFKNL